MPDPPPRTAPPLPRPHLLRQHWCDVTFLHWAVPPGSVQHLLPPGTEPDVADGATYVGLVPFRLVGTAAAHGPAIPWAGTFLETNVRLYTVDGTGRRGVVFLSMDAGRALPVVVGRAVFGLPYRWSRMRFRADGDVRSYTTRLRGRGPETRSRVVVRPAGPAPDGPLERFLTARWGLHVARLGRTWYLPNSHAPWPLRRAELLELDDGLLAAAGLGDVARRPPDHVAFSEGVTATFAPPAPVSGERCQGTANHSRAPEGPPGSGPARRGTA
ncbi:DUF2071 domain-containing protein [Pseudonocardia sp. C8]|uniref:YqjF family protein n=1 Tax=Pseudonocardia sp. C8 TaxID=2762759 RepID=UPI00164280EC|nr:DUF2071 domain-containing protein [Pseudonocardia sp. C8]MBC3191071.1 DUF2071 domain-containing protein [Pseudonocardia sp. C8]